MNREVPQHEKFVEYARQKGREYKQALNHGDVVGAEKIVEEFQQYLTEEQKLTIENLDLFDPATQSLILETREENWKLHGKTDYKELN
ncbi:MAG TPA: hypothetical protein VFX17_01015 [Patescibacteria group bacterium]|nr:hypothetical protein [Patescibacteria group bacterium]